MPYKITSFLKVTLFCLITSQWTGLLIEACLFRAHEVAPIDSILPGPWNDETLPRKINRDCICGEAEADRDPTWNLFIVGKNDDGTSKSCIGTIIASNLVITSHDCITKKGRKPRLIDVLQKRSDSNFLDIKNVEVHTTLNKSSPNWKVFSVKEIIFNGDHLINYKMNDWSLDIVLLKINESFIGAGPTSLRPICVPEYSDNGNFTLQLGYYYGPEKLGRAFVDKPENLIDYEFGVIFTQKMCDTIMTMVNERVKPPEEEDLVKPICLRFEFESNIPPPIPAGGPLILRLNTSSRTSEASFIIGTGSKTSLTKTGNLMNFAEFVNIMPMIKYIEYHASKRNVQWCQKPRMILPTPNQKGALGVSGPWPWESESMQEKVKNRNESLDCVCGVQNTEIGGRIVGGVQAFPREFGWMAVIILYHNGKGEGSNFCGGTIINDRLILTAAHCVVSEKKLNDGDENPVIRPENIEVTLNAHSRREDPQGIPVDVAAVLFHPEYIPAKKKKYFDFDVALLLLREALEFPPLPNKGLRPICLPKIGEELPTVGEMVTVAGWGLTNPTSKDSVADRLQKIELPIIPLRECKNVAKSKITENNICAGSLNMYHDAAAGDSGGPLKVKKGKQWTELALVSWGEDVDMKENGKTVTKTAALYTDIQKMLPFIDYQATRVHANWCKSAMPVNK